MRLFLFIIILSATFFGCKTDFEVNAPYDRVPIVYGLLDQSSDTHYIKINRTYLGSDNFNSAAINDCTMFDNVTARVEQYTNGSLGTVYPLQEKWVKNIDEGIFYTDSQLVYYFVEPSLDNNSVYKISGTADGKTFSAETDLLGNFDYANSTKLSTLNGFAFAANPGIYNTIDPKWVTANGGIRYDLSLRFYYEEHKNGNIYNKFVDWFLGSQKTPSDTYTGELQSQINGESFFIFLSNQKELIDTIGVTKRVIGKVELRVTAADFNFNTYMEVNEPSSSIVTERPEYTNIEGGYGIFAARRTLRLLNRTLNQKSVQELAEGQYTNDLLFCTDSVDWIGQSYHCP